MVPDLDADEVKRLLARGAQRWRPDPGRRPRRQQRGGGGGDRPPRHADQRPGRRLGVPGDLRAASPPARGMGREDHRLAEPARDLRGAAAARDAGPAGRLGLSLGRHPGAAVRRVDGAARRDPRRWPRRPARASCRSRSGGDRTIRSSSRGRARSTSRRPTRPSSSARPRRSPTPWRRPSPRRRSSGTASSRSGRPPPRRRPTWSGGRP